MHFFKSFSGGFWGFQGFSSTFRDFQTFSIKILKFWNFENFENFSKSPGWPTSIGEKNIIFFSFFSTQNDSIRKKKIFFLKIFKFLDPKMAQNGPKWPKMVQNGLFSTQNDSIKKIFFLIFFENFQIFGPSKTLKNGLKWLIIFFYEFFTKKRPVHFLQFITL